MPWKKRMVKSVTSYVTTFDDMRSWMEWRTTFIESTKTLWEEKFVLGVFEDRVVTQIRGQVASILATVDWIPVIRELQQRYSHDIVKLAHEPDAKLRVVCSCGLVADVPARVARRYGRKVSFLMFTAGVRQPSRDENLERWFFSEPGHRDVFYGGEADCFVSVSSEVGGSVSRHVVCGACGQVTPLTWSGKHALFRPVTYLENIERHRAVCSQVQGE
jgi:hypothetical protein